MQSARRYEWSKNFKNGDSYRGEATGENVKDGTGEYMWAANGATYKGSWSNDQPHGQGTMTVPGLDGYEYVGSFLRGQRSGQGTCRFNNGRVYIGAWSHDEMEGEGTLRGAAGLDNFVEYKGSFVAGCRHGPKGTCTYTNGDVYEGPWRKGKRHGHGELRLRPRETGDAAAATVTVPLTSSQAAIPVIPAAATGTGAQSVVLYRGFFDNDLPDSSSSSSSGGGGVGDAEMVYVDGSTYRGGVRQLQREGAGEHRMANGDVYTGDFRADLRDGRGTLRCSDGRVYDGTWSRGLLQGRVVYAAPHHPRASPSNGNKTDAIATRPSSQDKFTVRCSVVRYVGPVVQGEFTGQAARVTYSDGSVYSGEVRDALPHGAGLLENRKLRCGPDGWPSPDFGDTDLLLVRYEGGFSAGELEGEGTAKLQPCGGTVSIDSTMSKTPHLIATGARGFWLNYAQGGNYSGAWRRGLPEGEGAWRWGEAGGTGPEVYRGGLVHGLAHGNGCYESAQVRYEGSFARGQADGRGVYTHLLLRERYEGEWQAGMPHGEGVLQSDKTQMVYSGQWGRGWMSGKGSERRLGAAESDYEGDYVQGRWHGQGRARREDGTIDEGSFAEGKLDGHGCRLMPDGTRIEGSFTADVPHGRCEVRLPAGIVFRGDFVDGGIAGAGEIEYANGDRYRGEVEAGTAGGGYLLPQRHGKGIYTFVEGNRLECCWRHNVLHGEGVYTTVTGERSARNYVDGVLASRAADASNIFTPDNEFPNTQSESTLKEKMQTLSKPFAFVRRGEARQAVGSSAGGGTATTAATTSASQSGASTEVSPQHSHTSHKTLSPSPPASQQQQQQRHPPASRRGSTARKESVAPAISDVVRSGEGRLGHGGGATTVNGKVGHVASSVHDLRHPTRRTSVTHTSTPALAGIANASRGGGGGNVVRLRTLNLNDGGVDGSVHGGSGGPGSMLKRPKLAAKQTPGVTPTTISSAGDTSSRSVEAFQRALHHLQQSELTMSGPTVQGASATESSNGDSILAPLDMGAVRAVRGPLRGSLKTLMDEASAIRTSKEDEIHLLTEEVRELNEKIWQLRFSIASSSLPSASGAVTQLTPQQQERLKHMTNERRQVVEKLQCLLHDQV